MIGGGRRFVVNRSDGSVVELPGLVEFTSAVDDYEAPFRGFGAKRYDFIIHEVHRMQETLDFLRKLHLVYLQPRTFILMPDVTIMTPRGYEPEQITEMLSHLPCKFLSQNVRRFFRIFQQMNETRDCVYELIELSGEAARHPNYEFLEGVLRDREKADRKRWKSHVRWA